ncbi:MAG: C4-dicarboxylate ABC transporter substrate-binding protein [Gammaproteobacteria bacterium]|nr:C4-dicarboxylate ABC transporter substrate-binding protein [Gammaproteobacteria bacterium]
MKLSTALAWLVAAGLSLGIAQAQVNLSAETAAPTGVPGTSVLALAEVASKTGIADIQVKTGQTLTNSLQNLAEGKIDISAVPSLLPFLMSKGAGPYAKLGPEKGAELASQVAMLYTYRLALYGLSAYDSKNFGGWDAIEGKTIFNGPPRGAALTKARGLIKLATGLDDGEGYTGVQVNWGQAVKTITDGSADAQVLPMSFPDGRLGQAAASGAITVFSLPKSVYESETGVKYGKAPGVVAMVVPVTDEMFGSNISVVSDDGNFRGYGDVGGDAVNVSMDEETAYQLTKAFIENKSVYVAKAPFMGNTWLGETGVEKSGMCGANPVKYHAGAVRAWEEAGVSIPDCAKP